MWPFKKKKTLCNVYKATYVLPCTIGVDGNAVFDMHYMQTSYIEAVSKNDAVHKLVDSITLYPHVMVNNVEEVVHRC